MASIETNPVGEKTTATEPEKESFWTGGRVAITVIIVGLIIWYGVARTGSRSTPPTTSGVNTPATKPPSGNNPSAPAAFIAVPADIRDRALKTLDGDSLKLSDFDNKVLIVNIWAVWCGPCRMEMPELIKISNEYKSRGVVVLGLATAYNENRPQVEEFVKTNSIPYKVIFDDGTLEGPLVEAVQGRSVIPQSFVISRDGKIVKHFQGFNVSQTPLLMRQAIEDALNDKGKA